MSRSASRAHVGCFRLDNNIRNGPLAGIRVAGMGDSDPVVGEGGVAAGELDFGHVAAGAVGLVYGAGFVLSGGGGGCGRRGGFCLAVAGKAL